MQMRSRLHAPACRRCVGALFLALTSVVGFAAPLPGVWTMLLSGETLSGWEQVGTANWSVRDGVVEANSGSGYLVTPERYANFELRLEVWVSPEANSGIFFRGAEPRNITPETAYELNIFDRRPDPRYRTGAIVGLAEPARRVDADGHWNTVHITAEGEKVSVTFNGVKTVETAHAVRRTGVIALQCGAGTVKFRKVEIRRLS